MKQNIIVIGSGFGGLAAAIRLRAGAAPAICVALLLALSPVQIQLGTEVRGYGMMLGIAACAAKNWWRRLTAMRSSQ